MAKRAGNSQSKGERVINVELKTKEDTQLVPVRFTACICPRGGDSLPPLQQIPGTPIEYHFEKTEQIPRGLLRQVREDHTVGSAFLLQFIREMWPHMLRTLGPFRCTGRDGCSNPVAGFCSSPMSYLNLDPPFVHDIGARPVCVLTLSATSSANSGRKRSWGRRLATAAIACAASVEPLKTCGTGSNSSPALGAE